MPISTVRILLLGDSSVGKTSLSSQFVDRAFNLSTGFTVGIDYKVTTVTIEEKQVKIQIWDTAGQERFSSFTTPFYRSAHGVVFVYDMTKYWLPSLARKFSKGFVCIPAGHIRERKSYEFQHTEVEICHLVIPKVLIANKVDLSAQRSISQTSGKVLAETHSMPYFESSAKLNINVSEAFIALVKEVLEQFPYEATPVEEAPVLRPTPCANARGTEKAAGFERRSNFRDSKIYKGASAAISTLARRRKNAAAEEKKRNSVFTNCFGRPKRKEANDSTEN